MKSKTHTSKIGRKWRLLSRTYQGEHSGYAFVSDDNGIVAQGRWSADDEPVEIEIFDRGEQVRTQLHEFGVGPLEKAIESADQEARKYLVDRINRNVERLAEW